MTSVAAPRKLIMVLAVSVLTVGPLIAQRPASILQDDPQVIPLWAGRAPGALGDAPQDRPTLTIYMPPDTAGPMAAVVIAPGGGYTNVATNSGQPTATYLNTLGVAAFVLKYRVGPTYRHPIELGDAQRAIRIVRARAAEWHIAPNRVGLMGFSSGGHLASAASTHFDAGNPAAADPIDRVSSRPDFAVLASSVISFTEAWTHQASKRALLGEQPDAALVRSLSNETQVTPATPPTFIFHTDADTTVLPENSVQYYLALRRVGVPAELHVFKDGAHGIAALGMQDPTHAEWPKLLADWLRASGLIK